MWFVLRFLRSNKPMRRQSNAADAVIERVAEVRTLLAAHHGHTARIAEDRLPPGPILHPTAHGTGDTLTAPIGRIHSVAVLVHVTNNTPDGVQAIPNGANCGEGWMSWVMSSMVLRVAEGKPRPKVQG
jgi:hypothetical protein